MKAEKPLPWTMGAKFLMIHGWIENKLLKTPGNQKNEDKKFGF